jgi:hypothetical protein
VCPDGANAVIDRRRPPNVSSTNIPKERAMPDLAKLQKQLNTDPELRKKFLASPVPFLKKQGITLPKAAQKEVRSLVKQAKVRKQAAAAKPNISIMISIKINF